MTYAELLMFLTKVAVTGGFQLNAPVRVKIGDAVVTVDEFVTVATTTNPECVFTNVGIVNDCEAVMDYVLDRLNLLTEGVPPECLVIEMDKDGKDVVHDNRFPEKKF